MTLDAPRIALDVSFETRINHGSHFSWQAQYLVKLKITPDAPRIVLDVHM